MATGCPAESSMVSCPKAEHVSTKAAYVRVQPTRQDFNTKIQHACFGSASAAASLEMSALASAASSYSNGFP